MSQMPEFLENFLKSVPHDAKQPADNNGKTPRRKKKAKAWTIETQDAFLTKHNVDAKEREPYKESSTKRQLAKCPFCENSDHNTCVYLDQDGMAGFSCSHKSCKNYHWSDFLEHFEPRRSLYESTDFGMVMHYEDGSELISNFSAEIVADIVTDDGAEQTRSYALVVDQGGRHYEFEIGVREFSKCDWVDDHIGSRAVITVANNMRSHLINAIKECSASQLQKHYAHTGWRKINEEMVYLHAGGGIVSQVSHVENKNNNNMTHPLLFTEGASQVGLQKQKSSLSQVSQVSHKNSHESVQLTGPLAHYVFPDKINDLVSAIRLSLCMLELAPDTVTCPIYAATWRAPLGYVNFGIHLAGQSGQGKTEIAALAQQHYGPSMHANQLPGTWESTDNALEMQLFQVKDALMVIDDFKPKGSKSDQDRLHSKADRMFRQVGNGSARGRLTANLEQRAERRPRCLPVSTGEDVPRGQSCKARVVVLSMSEKITAGEASEKLRTAQKYAAKGIYSQAMAGYIAWLAPRIEELQAQLSDLIAEERDQLDIIGHARVNTNIANLTLGMRCFLQYALEMEAITYEQARQLLARVKNALLQVAQDASQENTHDTPSEQYLRLVRAAIAAKSAHLTTSDGKCPGEEYGWLRSERSSARMGEFAEDETLRGGGAQIGWIVGDDIYLNPETAYKAAKSFGSQSGDEIATQETTLRKFLAQDKVLASTDLDKKRKLITVRRRLQNGQPDVLHFAKKRLYPDDSYPTKHDSPDSPDTESSEGAPQAYPEIKKVSHVDDVSHVLHMTHKQKQDSTWHAGLRVITPDGAGMISDHTEITGQIARKRFAVKLDTLPADHPPRYFDEDKLRIAQ